MVSEISDALGGVPEGAVWALLAFAALTLVLQLVALVDLARRRRVLWDRKWVWVLLILLLNNGIGALLWFVLGRRVPQDDEVRSAARASVAGRSPDSMKRAVGILYGDEDHE
ncbi:MAG: hypothetical protein Kow0056_01380 [Coriobacteriia bacterium]